MTTKNIFENFPDKLTEEYFEKITEKENIKIERIISEAHASPPGFWYDQDKNEFVILLKGSARLAFQNKESITLNPGDYLIIDAHIKHRVEWTDDHQKTFWLAVHY